MLVLRLFCFQFIVLGALVLGLLLETSFFPQVTTASARAREAKRAARAKAKKAKRQLRAVEAEQLALGKNLDALAERIRAAALDTTKAEKKSKKVWSEYREALNHYKQSASEAADDNVSVSTGGVSHVDEAEGMAGGDTVFMIKEAKKGRHIAQKLHGAKVHKMTYFDGGSLEYAKYKRKYYIVSKGGPPPKPGVTASAGKKYQVLDSHPLNADDVRKLHLYLKNSPDARQKTGVIEFLTQRREASSRKKGARVTSVHASIRGPQNLQRMHRRKQALLQQRRASASRPTEMVASSKKHTRTTISVGSQTQRAAKAEPVLLEALLAPLEKKGLYNDMRGRTEVALAPAAAPADPLSSLAAAPAGSRSPRSSKAAHVSTETPPPPRAPWGSAPIDLPAEPSPSPALPAEGMGEITFVGLRPDNVPVFKTTIGLPQGARTVARPSSRRRARFAGRSDGRFGGRFGHEKKDTRPAWR